MDLNLTEEQQLLRNSARDFFERELPKETVKQLEIDPLGYSTELWKKMAELGWCGLTIPERYGGAEFGIQELVMLLDEMGRACLPGPFFSTIVLCAPIITAIGNEDQKSELLPKIVSGDLILSLALIEPSATYDPSGIATTAVIDKDTYIINGTKLFIHDAHCADFLLCVARTRVWSAPEDGISVLLVDPKTSGVSISPLDTISDDHQNEIIFKDVVVPAANLIGKVDQAWPVIQRILQEATVAKCAEMIGGCDWTVETSAAYAKERVQYGHPIGAYGSIQHYLADMWIESGMARRMTYYAAWCLDQSISCAGEIAKTKACVNEAYRHCTRMGVQIHGGIGTTHDHDIGLFYRRSRQAALLFDDTEDALDKVAQEMGL